MARVLTVVLFVAVTLAVSAKTRDYKAELEKLQKNYNNLKKEVKELRATISLKKLEKKNEKKTKTKAEAYLKTLWNGPSKGQPYTIPGLGMKLVYVAPGSFKMGLDNGDSDEKPVHRVTLSKGYWIGKYEVTQLEYQSIMKTNPSYFKGSNKPVETVSWNDAVKFCQKLTARERAAGRLPSHCEYRLPTEAEWEFAARAGTKSRGYKYSGSDSIDSVAWYGSNLGTHEVGTKSSNELGLYDMSGNVCEWCFDDWHSNYNGAPSNGGRWGDGTGSDRVFRGGSWPYNARYCRVANRYLSSPGRRGSNMGFRLVLASSSL